jgi:hypothetical protein
MIRSGSSDARVLIVTPKGVTTGSANPTIPTTTAMGSTARSSFIGITP